MNPIDTPSAYDAAPIWLIPPGRIVLRLTTRLLGPSFESHSYLERFEGKDLVHVLTVVPASRTLDRAKLDAFDLLATELERALRDISPF